MIPRFKRIPVAAFILIYISLPSKSSWYFLNFSTSGRNKMDTYHTYDSEHLKKIASLYPIPVSYGCLQKPPKWAKTAKAS